MIINGHNLLHLPGVMDNLDPLSFEAANEDILQYFHELQSMESILELKL